MRHPLNALLASLVASSALVFSETPALADISSYLSANAVGNWNTAGNWTGGIPNGAGDTAFVGPSAPASNSRVQLGSDVTLDGLLISDGMSVATVGHILNVSKEVAAPALVVNGANLVGGQLVRSRLEVMHQAPNPVDLFLHDASIEDGGVLHLANNAVVNVDGNLEIDEDSILEGGGILRFSEDALIVNQGIIRASAGDTLSLFSATSGFKLDGIGNFTPGPRGTLSAEAPDSQIRILGAEANGYFNGEMLIGPGSKVHSKELLLLGGVSEGLGPGRVRFLGTHDEPAVLSSDDSVIAVAGLDIEVSGRARIESPFQIAIAPVTITVADNSELAFVDHAKFGTGQITIGDNAAMRFHGAISDSNFTSWQINGGVVSSNNGSFINNNSSKPGHGIRGHGIFELPMNNENFIAAEGGKFFVEALIGNTDWDGATNEGELHALGGDFHLRDDQGEQFSGTLKVGNGHEFVAELPFWSLTKQSRLELSDGTLRSTGNLFFDGPVVVYDDSVVATSAALLDDAAFSLGGDLTLSGESVVVDIGAGFSGDGTLKVGEGGGLHLAHGHLLEVPLRNAGILVAAQDAAATVFLQEGFIQDTSGVLQIDLLGRPNTPNWDRLAVSGEAVLDGTLSVSVDAPGAVPGDVWKVVGAGAVVGQFASLDVKGLPANLDLVVLTDASGVYLKLVESSSFQDWVEGHNLPQGAKDIGDDADGDNLPNGLEMILGTDPKVPDSDGVFNGELIEVDGVVYLAISFSIKTSVKATNLAWKVERSIDMQSWYAEGVVVHSNAFDPETCVEHFTYRSVIPQSAQSREFIRVFVGAL